MARSTDSQYLLVVEWDDTVHRPSVVALHHLTPPDGMEEADFETFAIETILPELAATLTRAGGVTKASLLRAGGSPPGAFLDPLTLPSGITDEVSSYQLVGTCQRNPSINS